MGFIPSLKIRAFGKENPLYESRRAFPVKTKPTSNPCPSAPVDTAEPLERGERRSMGDGKGGAPSTMDRISVVRFG
jgi:hypothetical protein